MNTLLLLGLLAGSSPDDDAVAALALARAARERLIPVVTVTSAKTGYPVHPTRWTYPGEIHSHLKSGQHAGKWPSWWVDTLTRLQAESLHDADHEGRVDWSYVPSATKVPSKTLVNTQIYTPKYTGYSPAYCPPGASH